MVILRLVLAAGLVVLAAPAPAGPAPLSTACTVAAVAASLGILLLVPGAAAGTMLVLFLIFGSRGRISGTFAAIGWAFGSTVRRIVFTLVLLAAAAGGALTLVADHYGTGCPADRQVVRRPAMRPPPSPSRSARDISAHSARPNCRGDRREPRPSDR